MDFLLDSTSANEFNQALLITGMMLVGSIYISLIICSIQKLNISCFALTRYILYVPFCYAESTTYHNNVP